MVSDIDAAIAREFPTAIVISIPMPSPAEVIMYIGALADYVRNGS